MDILTLTSHYMNVFMLRRSNALILSYSFQLLHHFRFWRPFWIFRFQSFFDRKLLSKCANDAYFRSQEVKTYQIGYLTWKNSFICKKRYFRRPFCIFYPLVLPEVDNIVNWVTIPNLVMRNTTHIPNYKKIGSKLWPWQCSHFFVKDGGRDVIGYVNELKLERT